MATEWAAVAGVSRDDVVVGLSGFVMPDPEKIAAGTIPDELMNDTLKAYLPKFDAASESKADWVDRATVELFAKGVLTVGNDGNLTYADVTKDPAGP